MAYTTRLEGCPLGEIETWIFDLDNTLYPASCRLFDQVQQRMNEYISDRFGLDQEEAAELRRTYFREHGTTLRGLMTVNRIDPHDFLAFVHEIDLSCVPPDPALIAAMNRLRGRKIIHTNGSSRRTCARGRTGILPGTSPRTYPACSANGLKSRPCMRTGTSFRSSSSSFGAQWAKR